MERSGLGSKRIDMFPAGLRVLVVDDDPTWLKILEKMLKKCSYEVTKCSLATEALDILRKRKDGFDIVISDVNMPDMDGFKLLEHVGLEMNLPVIMMSVDGEITRVMKGVLHGACDYLLKPIRMKELQNIWQHVLRKKIHKVKDIENHEGSEAQMIRSDVDAFDDSHLLVGGDFASARKRKDSEHLELYDHDFSDPSAAKKARVVWSVDLHQKFVNAVNQVGLDKVGPKKILDLMNVPWLTRENVASHLQKYRLYLSRLQKRCSPSHDATKPDFSSMDLSSSFNLKSSTAVHQNTATSCSFGYSGNKMHVQDTNPELQEVNSKACLPFLSITNPQTDLIVSVPRFQKLDSALRTGHTNSTLRTGHTNSFGLGPNVNYALFEPTENSQTIQFTPSPTEEHKLTGYIHRPKHHIQADLMQTASSVNIGNSIAGRVKVDPVNMNPLCTVYGNNHISTVSRTPHRVGSLSVKPQIKAANTEVSDNMPSNIISASTKKQTFDQWCTSIWGTQPKNSIVGSLPPLPSPQGNANLLPLQDGYVENVGFGNLDFSDYLAPELITELPSHLHDGTRFNSDFLFDSIEYPTISEGLFIT